MIYAGSNDVSRVPPEWYAWLTRQIDGVPDEALPPPPKFLQGRHAEPDRHARGLSAGRRARARRPARRGERRLSGLDARLRHERGAASVAAFAALLALAACGADAARARPAERRPTPRAETVDIPQTVTRLAARHDADGASGSRCSACSTSATARCANSPCGPGQAVRVGDVIVRLRACETTAPWEVQQLTGAFVQLDVRNPQGQFQRVFSGWLYKETPSLNVVEHPIYDVWPMSCAMTHPGGGTPAPSAASGEQPVERLELDRARRRTRRRARGARPRRRRAPNPTAPDNPSGRSRSRRGWQVRGHELAVEQRGSRRRSAAPPARPRRPSRRRGASETMISPKKAAPRRTP